MTVSQISSAAGVSRQTFYSLFASKYDIAYWYLKKAESRFLVEIGRTLSLSDGISNYFEFLGERTPYLANAFERKPDKRELRERLDYLINEMLQTASGKGVDIDEDFKFCVSYTVESANCLVASCVSMAEPATMRRPWPAGSRCASLNASRRYPTRNRFPQSVRPSIRQQGHPLEA